MITPPPLLPGNTIGIMAPSSRIARTDIEASKEFLEQKGYKVFIHPQTYQEADTLPSTQYAGTTADKLNALHDLASNKDIKAVFFATGGQRSMLLLDEIDYELIKANPKIYMGFSDHTFLLNAIAATSSLVTFHGPTFKGLRKNPQIDFNLRLLAGQEKTIPLDGAIILKSGTAQGNLIGGNLAAFRNLQDRDLLPTKGTILFLEEIGEELTTIDRDLYSLHRRGILENISGLIFGQFTNMKDTGTPFGLTLEDIINEHTKDLKIPVLMNAPFGHGKDLYTFPVGKQVKLDTQVPTLQFS